MSRHRVTPRLYVDLALSEGARVDLPAEAAHHAAQVVRLREGEAVVLFNGRGGEFPSRVAAVGRRTLAVEVGAFVAIERESPLRVTLVQALSTGERMDLTVQKSVELGVHAIQPVASDASVVRLPAERATARRLHWQRIAIAACEQCGRNWVPRVEALEPLARYSPPAAALKLLLAPAAPERLVALAAEAAGDIVLACGPEAGFGETEERRLIAAGFRPVSLGPRVLRTETAAPAALAALNALAGDF